jgi:hypothetical protein
MKKIQNSSGIDTNGPGDRQAASPTTGGELLA